MLEVIMSDLYRIFVSAIVAVESMLGSDPMLGSDLAVNTIVTEITRFTRFMRFMEIMEIMEIMQTTPFIWILKSTILQTVVEFKIEIGIEFVIEIKDFKEITEVSRVSMVSRILKLTRTEIEQDANLDLWVFILCVVETPGVIWFMEVM